MDERAGLPDWRDAAAYAPLLGAERALFAWEWLRRDPLYRQAWGSRAVGRPDPAARRFGVVAFENPAAAVPDARPLWRREVHPYVLEAERCADASPADRIDLGRLGRFVTAVAGGGSEHVLLSDGLRSIRIDAPAGILTGGPVALRYRIEGLASAGPPLLALRRLIALCRTGRLAGPLHRPEARARRWVLMLRASDALRDGADQRAIAGELFRRPADGPRWRVDDSSLRSQVQRLVRASRLMAAGGYRTPLD